MKNLIQRAILTFAVALLTAPSVMALEQEAGLRFVLADPTGAFGREVDDVALGLSVHYGVRPGPAFTVGVGATAASYGSESTRHDLPLVDDFDLTTTNNLAGGFLFVQWRPLDGPVQPYAEARGGLNYLWTESKLEDDDWWGDDEVARETNLDDFAPFWGAGGGLLIRLSERQPEAGKLGVLLDLKVAYQRGGEAEYLTEGDITVVDDRPVFASNESATDLVTYEVGVVLTF